MTVDGAFPRPAPIDSEERAHSRLFTWTAGLTAAIATAVFLAVGLVEPARLPRVFRAIAVVDLTVLGTLALNYRGHTRLASWLFLGVIIGYIAFVALGTGGVRSPGVQAWLVFVILAGLLLDFRAGIIIGAVCVALGFGLVVAEWNGLLDAYTGYLPLSQWLVTSMYIGVALVAMRAATARVASALQRANSELRERHEAEQHRERLVHDLRERVKELRLIHDTARLLQHASAVDRVLLGDLVRLMPGAWLHADDACARITYLDIVVGTPDWRETPWVQVARFSTSDADGLLEVAYKSEHATKDEGPFLAEERALIDSIAELLRTHIEQRVVQRQREGLEAQLRQAQRLDSLGTLAGGIAHDFNNILTAIGGNAQLAALDAPEGSELAEHVGEIIKGHDRAKALVRRILLFSRREEPSEHAVLSIVPVVDEAVKLLRASLPKNITIDVTIAPGLPYVSADATQLHQVVMNLGTNAGYAMKERGGTIAIALDTIHVTDAATAPSVALEEGPHVRMTVRDTGVGMSREVLDHLFEPFFTTKGLAGTGLGLAVVHGIIGDHDGAITVESEVGVGTAFAVYLPAQAGAVRRKSDDPRVFRGAGQHLMYVDDEASLTLLMARTFQTLGYRCTPFTDAAAALHEFRTAPSAFDAVVTDLQMPNMSGLELARTLRGIRAGMPIAIASGYAADRSHDPEAASVVWIQKPSNLVELSAALHRLLAVDDSRPAPAVPAAPPPRA